jgi:hypothetical protein
MLPLWSGGAGLDGEVVPIAKVVSADGTARVQVTRWRPRNIAFSIDATVPGTAVIAQLYYPGWQVVSVTTGRDPLWLPPRGCRCEPDHRG